MVSIEAYRSRVGSFAYSAQRDLKSITKNLIIGTLLTSYGLSRILKPAPCVALFLFLTFAFPKAYQIDEPKVNKKRIKCDDIFHPMTEEKFTITSLLRENLD